MTSYLPALNPKPYSSPFNQVFTARHALVRDIEAEHVYTLEIVSEFLGRCPHGFDLWELVEAGDFRWWVNTYICSPEGGETPLFVLSGNHDGIDDYCVPYGFHPAGVVFPWSGWTDAPSLGFGPLTVSDPQLEAWFARTRELRP